MEILPWSDNMLWISDVGQNCWEEVNLVPINETKNLGWSSKEAFQNFDKNSDCESDENYQDDNLTYPVTYYGHQEVIVQLREVIGWIGVQNRSEMDIYMAIFVLG